MATFDDDAVELLGRMTQKIAEAIGGRGAPGHDATGGTVGSLTEAVMGTTAGLVQIAEAINNLADAVRENTTFNEPGT